MKCNIFEVPGNSYTGVTGPDCFAQGVTGTTGTGTSSSGPKSAGNAFGSFFIISTWSYICSLIVRVNKIDILIINFV